jgi:transposase
MHIGMDVHKVHTQICVLDDEARVVCQMRVSTRRDALSKHLCDYGGSRALIEASTESEWVAQVVESLGIEVVIADPNYLAMYASRGVGKKTDKRDAHALALALRQGIYRPVVRRSAADRHKLDLLGMRDLLVRQRTAAINEVRAFCRRHGLRLPKCAAATVPKHAQLLLLGSPLWDVCEPLWAMLRTLNEQIAVCEKKLAQLAAQDPQVQRLMTVPSVGLITAVCAVAILGDPRRFSDAHKVASYLGLVPRENSSGGRVHKGRLTKTGNRMMRRLLVQCAHGVMQRRTADTAHLWQWAEAITARKKKGTAAVALARRLGGILWAMLRDERPYTPKPRHSEIDAAQVATPADTPRRKRSRTTSTRTPVRHGPSQTAQPGA